MSRSIIPGDVPGRCYICAHYGKPPEALRKEGENGYCAAFSQQIEEHHIFGGPHRKLSEHYGLKVHLCIYHHTSGSEAVHNNRTWDLRLKQIGQKAFEERYSYGEWMQVFGRDYLGEDESSRERRKMVLVDECVTDCGNMKCRFNSANIKEKNVRMVFMRDNPKMGCEGYKRVGKETERKGKAGEIATKRADAPEKKANASKKKANAPEKAGRITERGKNTTGKERAAAGTAKTKKASAAAGRAKKKRITSGKVKK